MKFLFFYLLLISTEVWAENGAKTAEEFLKVTDRCCQRHRLPQGYRTLFRRFEYPDEPDVHKYIHCVATELGLWDDTNGFSLEAVHQQYHSRADEEVVLPIIADCNNKTRTRDKDLWCYRAFMCILDTPVGQWFKDDVRKTQTSLLNGPY